jgi:hypothetical protein
MEHSPAEHARRPPVPAESRTLRFTHLQFEALLTAARESDNPCDFAPVAVLGLLGLRIFEAMDRPASTCATSRSRPACRPAHHDAVRQSGPARSSTVTQLHPRCLYGFGHLISAPGLAIAADAYSIRCMAGLYEVEIEPEVRSWLAGRPDRDFGRVDFLVGLLAEHAEDLGEPYTRHLGGKVRELRFHLLRQQTRVTYWLAPGRRVILLTVFRKTRGAETAEVARALRAQVTCETRHSRVHLIFDREVN